MIMKTKRLEGTATLVQPEDSLIILGYFLESNQSHRILLKASKSPPDCHRCSLSRETPEISFWDLELKLKDSKESIFYRNLQQLSHLTEDSLRLSSDWSEAVQDAVNKPSQYCSFESDLVKVGSSAAFVVDHLFKTLKGRDCVVNVGKMVLELSLDD